MWPWEHLRTSQGLSPYSQSENASSLSGSWDLETEIIGPQPLCGVEIFMCGSSDEYIQYIFTFLQILNPVKVKDSSMARKALWVLIPEFPLTTPDKLSRSLSSLS